MLGVQGNDDAGKLRSFMPPDSNAQQKPKCSMSADDQIIEDSHGIYTNPIVSGRQAVSPTTKRMNSMFGSHDGGFMMPFYPVMRPSSTSTPSRS